MYFYLWYSWATRVRSERSDQRHGEEGEQQRPEDVHQVVHDVGERSLNTHTHTHTQTHTCVRRGNVWLIKAVSQKLWGEKIHSASCEVMTDHSQQVEPKHHKNKSSASSSLQIWAWNSSETKCLFHGSKSSEDIFHLD